MIRGAIDLVQDNNVGGWIYSQARDIKGHTILAFLDERCVGSGQVRFVREDLKAAGLGDGLCGFKFQISVSNPEDLCRVVVKLEGSDLLLLQPGATVGKSELFQPVFANLDRLEWLRKKGLLEPTDFTFLKYLQQMSVFDYSLVAPKSQTGTKGETVSPLVAAQSLFDILGLRQISVREIAGAPMTQEELSLAVLSGGQTPLPIVAIYAKTPGEVALVEGSHLEDSPGAGFDGAVTYNFGPDRLLFLHLNARFKFGQGPTPPLRIFSAA